MRVPDIIDLLGGPTAVGLAIDVPSTTISNWKGRGSIPARYHDALVRMGKGKVTPAMLVQAHASEPVPPAPVAAE